ncbi:MAG TPA: hypothetical protein VEM57_01395 [Candidatus Binatus sp.]|nr:hypothetical protein [Candidatus Binatus sp.]
MTLLASLPVLRRIVLLIGILVLFCVRSGASAHEYRATSSCSGPSDDDGNDDHEECGDDLDDGDEEGGDDDGRSCDDHDPCTADACSDGHCVHDAIPGCTACSEASQCGDGDACTADTCPEGVCEHHDIEGCQRCESDGDCGDGDACTADACSDGACSHEQTAGCQPCAADADCDDHDLCTGESCTAGACKRFTIADCQPCTTATDCDDRSACTTDTCSDGVCQHGRIEGCTPCAADTDCSDGDACTINRCDAGACAHERAPECSKPQEICGDCIDNDGDGLVDYEDPDCCAQMQGLAVQRMMVRRPGGKAHRKRLRLKAVYAEAMPPGFDPQRQDTSIQISDRRGQLLCKTIQASHWMKRRRGFKFWDMNGSFAGGLSDGRFMTRQSGRVLFRTQGKKVQLRSVEGTNLRVTVRVGTRCTQSSMTLQQRKNGLSYP